MLLTRGIFEDLGWLKGVGASDDDDEGVFDVDIGVKRVVEARGGNVLMIVVVGCGVGDGVGDSVVRGGAVAGFVTAIG